MNGSLLDKLDRKIGRFALRNLMLIIVIGTAFVFLVDNVLYRKGYFLLSEYLYFSKPLILQGEVWRLFTFVFVPQSYNIFLLALSLYFYWMVGSSLERAWGSFKFDVYYFVGWLGAIGGGFLTGYATVYYLHLSLFLAFAILYPNYRVLFFFFIPMKMKVLAFIDLGFLALEFVLGSWAARIIILISLLNIPLFFTGKVIDAIRRRRRRKKWQREANVFEMPKMNEDEEIKVKKIKKRDDDDNPFEL